GRRALAWRRFYRPSAPGPGTATPRRAAAHRPPAVAAGLAAPGLAPSLRDAHGTCDDGRPARDQGSQAWNPGGVRGRGADRGRRAMPSCPQRRRSSAAPHAFHAGNHADVFKHSVLLALCEALASKPAPCFALDTHAGRGLYFLDDEASRRTGEANEGVEALLGHDARPPALEPYRAAIAA